MIDFASAKPSDVDEIPELDDIEYPCVVCGQESGPYGGRGPKPKRCPIHKKAPAGKAAPRVAGKDANLAAQATGVLVQLNAMIAMGAAAVGLFNTAVAIKDANEAFESTAYQALVTDPEFCKFLLKGGAKSAKLSLALAYGGMGVYVAPIAASEIKLKREERAEAKAKAEADNADGY
jgi:hypothetical protein